MAKLETSALYYKWTDEDKYFQPTGALDGDAGTALWGAGDIQTYQQLVDILRARYSSLNQSDRYHAEMANRKRKKRESLSELAQECRRYMLLTYNGQLGAGMDRVARDNFLKMINDPVLKMNILVPSPAGLEEALKVGLRLETIGFGQSEVSYDDQGRKKNVRVIEVQDESDKFSPITQELQAVQKRLTNTEAELNQCKARTGSDNRYERSFDNNRRGVKLMKLKTRAF